MEGEKAKSLGLKPLARLLAGVAAGVDPRVMGIGPVAATQKLLKTPQLAHISLQDFDLIEINEAFASQSLACAKELGLKADIINVNGGAIALGHPLGMSGARICTTLLHEMDRRGARFGLATICVAGGLGMSMAFEKPEG
jgi:acetyl-CoA C-acetyltransferase